MKRPRAAAVVTAAVVVGAGAAWAVTGAAGEEGEGRGRNDRRATATVERRDLVERETLDGTLGFAGTDPVRSGLAGTVTSLRKEGTVARRGDVLYRVDDRPVLLLYGRLPAWRSFQEGMSDGRDVEQLERNLAAMGYDPDGDIQIDREFDWATEAAIERWQRALGVDDDGTLDLGEIVFRPGPSRVGEHKLSVGDPAGTGAEVMDLSSTRRIVTLEIEAARQDLVREGDRVRVRMPDGSTVSGVVTHVGRVAQLPGADEDDAEPTVEVIVGLPGRPEGRLFDQVPVDVEVETARARDVLAVPVSALLALAEGGYALEVVNPDGSTRLVAVQTGTYANGWVEVEGPGIEEGTRVVVPE